MRILVVDDERYVVDVVRTMLQAKGHEVVTAADGEEALEAVGRELPELVLLDIVMPKLDGAMVAQRLRDSPHTRHIPIVFLTGLIETDESQRRGPKIGGQLFLAKPFDAEELYQMIELAAATQGGSPTPPTGD